MVKYTEVELLSYQSQATLPAGVDLTPFNELVESVKEALREIEEANPRRKSFSQIKRKKQPKETKQTDEDGWTSFVAPVKAKKLSIDAGDKRDVKQHTMKVKTSTSKISSGKASNDARDNVVITQASKFNAFDALNDDDEAIASDDEEEDNE